MAAVEWGNAAWHDPKVLGRRLFFFFVFCMVLLAQRDNVGWFITRLLDWGDDGKQKSRGLLRLVFHVGFFLKFLSSRTHAGMDKWTAIWCVGILVILVHQHGLAPPAAFVLMVVGLAFKVGSHELSIILQLGFARKLESRFKILSFLTAVVTLIVLFTAGGDTVLELRTYFLNFKSIVRSGPAGWPRHNHTVAVQPVVSDAPKESPLIRSKLVTGGQHVLVLGSPQQPAVRAVVESLQSDGHFAVTLASGYSEAVSAVAEYNFNGVVLPRANMSQSNLEIARVVLALKCRYRGQLRPERDGKLVDQIRGNLTPAWPGGLDSWRVLMMVNPEWDNV